MICRIRSLAPLPDFRLAVAFDDGKRVVYDVKEDFSLPGYSILRDVPFLFEQAQLDQSRTCVFWNEEIDLPSDAIYEYGLDAESWDPDFTKQTPAEAAAVEAAETQETVSMDAINW